MDITETDDEPREAKIYLYTRPVERLQTKISSLNSLQNSNSDLAECIQHWIFVVKFIDKTMYLEANETNNKLVPKVFHDEPPNIIKKKFLGTTKVSPAYIVQKALANQFNLTEYDLAFQNCQNWFVEMYQLLGLKEENCPVPVKYHIDAARSIASASIAGLRAAGNAWRLGSGPVGAIFASGAVSSSVLSEENITESPCFQSLQTEK